MSQMKFRIFQFRKQNKHLENNRFEELNNWLLVNISSIAIPDENSNIQKLNTSKNHFFDINLSINKLDDDDSSCETEELIIETYEEIDILDEIESKSDNSN